MTRRAKLVRAGKDVPAPDADEMLCAHLVSIGMVEQGGMGPVPLSWAGMRHWQALTGWPLYPPDAEHMVAASCAYIAAMQEYDGKSAASPLAGPVERQSKVDADLRAGMKALMAGRK